MAIYRGSGGSAVADTLNIDGDYGDITVTSSGQEWAINPEAVTLAKIQTIATDTLLGRATTGIGVVEQISLTQAGRALLDDANASAQRTTLGLGTAATTDSTAYATAAQGTLANTAIQPADITDVVRDADIVNMLETVDIGVTVQGYDANTAKLNGVTQNFIGTLQNGGSNVVVDSDIGATVLAHDANLQSFVNAFTLPTIDSTNGFVLQTNGAGTLQLAAPGGLPDGDKGDITVSAGGTVWNIDAGVVTTTELGGDITTAGKALLDDATAGDQRTTLGLGTIATQSAASVAITGGSITGITDLTIADGGTGASDAATAFSNLKQAASDTATGVVELLTEAEYTTGTDTTRALTASIARAKNIVAATAVASTSGTAIDFTGIPSWAKRITVMFSGVSTNGTSIPQIQIGDSGGIENTGYTGTYMSMVSGNSVNGGLVGSGWAFANANAATSVHQGCMTITKVATNNYILNGVTATSDVGRLTGCSCSKTLTSDLTQVRITTVNGTDTFDAGTVNIMYE